MCTSTSTNKYIQLLRKLAEIVVSFEEMNTQSCFQDVSLKCRQRDISSFLYLSPTLGTDRKMPAHKVLLVVGGGPQSKFRTSENSQPNAGS